MDSTIFIIAALVVTAAFVAVHLVRKAAAKAKAREWKEHAKKRSKEQHQEWENARKQAEANKNPDGL